MKKILTLTLLTAGLFSMTSFGPEDSSRKFIGTETTYGTCNPYNGQGGRGVQSKTETFYLFGIAISTSTTFVDCETGSKEASLSID